MSERGLLHFLRSYHGEKILPAVAAAEYSIHVKRKRGWTTADLLAGLRSAGITIEPLDAHRALAAVDLAGDGFPDRTMDALIGAHALAAGRVLVTNNLRHHPHVPRKITPSRLLEA
jgi:predicted nucleic acid-binding protein